MFDISAAKKALGIEPKKTELDHPPRANRANCANPRPQISTFSTFSTPYPLNSKKFTDLERTWKRSIHPLDPESRVTQKISWVLAEAPEIDLTPAELKHYYRNDIKTIDAMSLEAVYRILADYWSNK